jgi:hypothetical protein
LSGQGLANCYPIDDFPGCDDEQRVAEPKAGVDFKKDNGTRAMMEILNICSIIP